MVEIRVSLWFIPRLAVPIGVNPFEVFLCFATMISMKGFIQIMQYVKRMSGVWFVWLAGSVLVHRTVTSKPLHCLLQVRTCLGQGLVSCVECLVTESCPLKVCYLFHFLNGCGMDVVAGLVIHHCVKTKHKGLDHDHKLDHRMRNVVMEWTTCCRTLI